MLIIVKFQSTMDKMDKDPKCSTEETIYIQWLRNWNGLKLYNYNPESKRQWNSAFNIWWEILSNIIFRTNIFLDIQGSTGGCIPLN